MATVSEDTDSKGHPPRLPTVGNKATAQAEMMGAYFLTLPEMLHVTVMISVHQALLRRQAPGSGTDKQWTLTGNGHQRVLGAVEDSSGHPYWAVGIPTGHWEPHRATVQWAPLGTIRY